MDKVIRDGKVAVLISCGPGAGWSTWNRVHLNAEALLFDPEIVKMVLDKHLSSAIAAFAESRYSSDEHTVYTGGSDGLAVEWIPEGTRFMIAEHDGHERIITEHDLPYTA